MGLELIESSMIPCRHRCARCLIRTAENRQRYNRDSLRYPSDPTDEEWSLVESMIPSAKRGGRRRKVDAREILNGIMYVLGTGCQWRGIPKDLSPRSTLHRYFQRWQYDGTWRRIEFKLYQQCREAADRQASPTACIIDSQSVKGAEKGGANIDPKGYDAGKKVSGIKRHIPRLRSGRHGRHRGPVVSAG